jgi:tRNA(Ile2) C34 agmatinyltransferase TiaS
MNNDKNIFESWKENLGKTRPWDMLDPNIERAEVQVAEERLNVCKACPELIKVTGQCKKCGCFMHLKTKLEAATCPIGKW